MSKLVGSRCTDKPASSIKVTTVFRKSWGNALETKARSTRKARLQRGPAKWLRFGKATSCDA
jgi:hypothetical protein